MMCMLPLVLLLALLLPACTAVLPQVVTRQGRVMLIEYGYDVQHARARLV